MQSKKEKQSEDSARPLNNTLLLNCGGAQVKKIQEKKKTQTIIFFSSSIFPKMIVHHATLFRSLPHHQIQ